MEKQTGCSIDKLNLGPFSKILNLNKEIIFDIVEKRQNIKNAV